MSIGEVSSDGGGFIMLFCAYEMSVCELVSAAGDGSAGCSLISEKSVSEVSLVMTGLLRFLKNKELEN